MGFIPFFLSEGTTVVSAIVPTEESNSGEILSFIWGHLTSGDTSAIVLSSAVLMLLVSVARASLSWGKEDGIRGAINQFLYGSDTRGSLTVLLVAMIGAFATSGVDGHMPTKETFGTAILVGLGAIGGYSGVWKRLILPILKMIPWAKEHLPESPNEAKQRAADMQNGMIV